MQLTQAAGMPEPVLSQLVQTATAAACAYACVSRCWGVCANHIGRVLGALRQPGTCASD